MPDSAMNMLHLEGFQQAQDLQIFALTRFTHSGFEQMVKGCKRIWDIPALQRSCLIQSASLLLQQRQVVHRIEDYIGFLV